VAAGKPQDGQLFNTRCSTKLEHKTAVKDAYIQFDHEHADEMYEHFLNKRPTEFWKAWNAKFRRNINKDIVIDGCQPDHDIANKFASHSVSIYKQNDAWHSSRCDTCDVACTKQIGLTESFSHFTYDMCQAIKLSFS
jgi:hypothetical protein